MSGPHAYVPGVLACKLSSQLSVFGSGICVLRHLGLRQCEVVGFHSSSCHALQWFPKPFLLYFSPEFTTRMVLSWIQMGCIFQSLVRFWSPDQSCLLWAVQTPWCLCFQLLVSEPSWEHSDKTLPPADQWHRQPVWCKQLVHLHCPILGQTSFSPEGLQLSAVGRGT